jgi:hypothetical protein
MGKQVMHAAQKIVNNQSLRQFSQSEHAANRTEDIEPRACPAVTTIGLSVGIVGHGTSAIPEPPHRTARRDFLAPAQWGAA